MRPTFLFSCATALVSAPGLAETLLDGADAGLDLRYRLEVVDQDGFTENAAASTLLARLWFKTGEVKGFSGFLEGTRTQALGAETYNSTVNGVTDRPVVADPELTEFNQGYVQYRNNFATLRLGRQGFNLDNQRFVGTVAFRQNDQTYDAATAKVRHKDFEGFYGYVWNVNRIFGNESPQGDFDTNLHVINASYSGLTFGKLTGYAYLLDINDQAFLGLSTATFGARFAGKRPINETVKVAYEAEYARQSDYQDSPRDYAADYLMGSLAVTAYGLTLKGHYEKLGSDNGVGFSTPLSTLHKFNGWADRFLVTPGAGLRDMNVSLGFKIKGDTPLANTNVRIIYHDFNSDVGGANFGTEWDFIIKRKINSWLSAEVKAAFFNAQDLVGNSSRAWFTLAAKF